MRQDVEAPPPAQQGAVLTPPPPPPVAAAAAAPHRDPPSTTTAAEASATSFIASVQKVFAPCVGVVDAASLFMGNCRFGKDAYHDAGDRMRLRTTGMHQQQQKLNQKRQGETLEIPSHGGFFDDDVSAISAHTLEEMERLRQAHHQNNPSKLQMLTPPNHKYISGSSSNHNRKKGPPYRPRGTHSANRSDFGNAARGAFSSKQQLWDMHPQPPHPSEEEECSIGASTSGSSSAEDEPARITTRGSNRTTAANRQAHKATTTSARHASA